MEDRPHERIGLVVHIYVELRPLSNPWEQQDERDTHREIRPSSLISIRVSGGGLGASQLNRECRYRISGELAGCSRVDDEVNRPAIDVCS